MRSRRVGLAVVTFLYLTLDCCGKMIRNNALMNQMMSHFQKDNNLSIDPGPKVYVHQEAHTLIQDPPPPPPSQKAERILSLMQNILCKNFPSIPCKAIIQDEALSKLIEHSILQITSKQQNFMTTQAPHSQGYGLTLFPTFNSEDLSNFLAVSQTGSFDKKIDRKINPNKRKRLKNLTPRTTKIQNYWSYETASKKKAKIKDAKQEMYTGRKKLRKFYPHKVKYKDKGKGEYAPEYSSEKLSMSVEIPDVKLQRKRDRITYKMEPADSPVWRIDYMKHGIPSLNAFGYDDERFGKIMKTGPNVIVDETGLEQVRKEVLRPDVYIKKNARKNIVNMNSEGVID